jgi:hypothetical protein
LGELETAGKPMIAFKEIDGQGGDLPPHDRLHHVENEPLGYGKLGTARLNERQLSGSPPAGLNDGCWALS